MALSLKEFIAETLTEIVGGIDDAKSALNERHDWISPPIRTVGLGGNIHDADVSVFREGGYYSKAHMVRFDVAVHATASGEVGGKLQVAAPLLGRVEAGGKGEFEDKSISRVRFDIPLVLAELPEPEIEVRKSEIENEDRLRRTQIVAIIYVR